MAQPNDGGERPEPLVYTGDNEYIPVYVVASGLVLTVGLVGRTLLLASFASPLGYESLYPLSGLASFSASVVLIIGGYWLIRGPVPDGRYTRIFTWYVAGLFPGGFVVLSWVQATSTTDIATFYWLLVGTSIGGSVGLLVGLIEARTIVRELATQRVEMESRYRKRQRSFLKRIHALVRHEVLNTTQVISGYASNRLRELDRNDPEYDYYETIDDQSQSLASVVDDIEVLLRASDTAVETEDETTNLTNVLSREVAKLRTEYPDTDFDVSVDGDVFVRTDSSISTVLGYLLSHRISQFGGGRNHVEIDIEANGTTVNISVTDDGPELPSDEIHSPFEQPPEMDRSHGWALYLTDAVVELYDGNVELDPAESDGSAVTIELLAGSPPRPEKPEATGGNTSEPESPKELF